MIVASAVNAIKKNELKANLKDVGKFLKEKGVLLQEGIKSGEILKKIREQLK